MIEGAKQDVVIVSRRRQRHERVLRAAGVNSSPICAAGPSSVDAPDTAYALQAKKILVKHGAQGGDYTIKPVGAGVSAFKAMLESKNNAAGSSICRSRCRPRRWG